MKKVAIIGGTGLTELPGMDIVRREVMNTPYGEPSSHITFGRYGQTDLVFLPRHGHAHTIPPHKINYRANIYALHACGVDHVIAIAAVGGIAAEASPGCLVIPDQLIDYTYEREHTFFDGDQRYGLKHIDFTQPYTPELRQQLMKAAISTDLKTVNHGIYAATQGPRLETAAEIDRYERDGCTVVGMTAMPEAALARELDLAYASCNVVINWAAGRGERDIHADIEMHLAAGMERVRTLLAQYLNNL